MNFFKVYMIGTLAAIGLIVLAIGVCGRRPKPHIQKCHNTAQIIQLQAQQGTLCSEICPHEPSENVVECHHTGPMKIYCMTQECVDAGN